MQEQELHDQLNKIRVNIKNNNLVEAKLLLDVIMADKTVSNNINFILEQGQYLLACQNFNESEKWLKKVLLVEKNNIYAIEGLIKISCALKNYNSVAEYMKMITENTIPNSEFIISDLINKLIEQLFEHKNRKNDIEETKKIIKILHFYSNFIKEKKIKNIVINEYEILEKKTILQSKPRMLIVSMTSRCNIKCEMCSIPYKHWDFPKNRIKEIFNLIPYLHTILWHGGEPFLCNEIDGLIVEAGKYNLKQIISTNGLLLNSERIKKIINSRVELNISIHGLTKQVYENIHHGAKFETLLSNLKTLKNIKEQNNIAMRYGLKFLVMKSNYKQLEYLYDFVNKYGFNHVYINTLGAETINSENFLYHFADNQILKKVLYMSNELSNKFKKNGIFYEAWLPAIENDSNLLNSQEKLETDINNDNVQEKHCCYIPWESLYIDVEGNIRNGCDCNNLIIGNINNENLENVWNNEKIIEIRKNIINNGFDKRCSEDCKNGRILKEYLKNPVN